MITRLAAIALAIVSSVALPACRSMSDVVEAHQAGDGTLATYPVDAGRAFALSAAVLRAAGADSVEQHPQENYMLASFSTGAFSYGTLVGVWIEPGSPTSSAVRVISKRVAATGAISDLTESTFHEQLAARISSPPSTAAR